MPAMHALSVMNTFVTALVMYMLLMKTPPEMGVYRWFLLNVTVGLFEVTSEAEFFSNL